MKLTETISVSEYISVINEILSGVEARVEGEISGLKKAASGHVYFMLKDEKGVINCAIWKSIYMMCGVSLEEGMKVVVSGSSDVYPVRGSLTFKVRTVQLAGEGELKKAYERLKKKLQEEGVFDNERSLPLFPQKIGVITSLRGAAIHDFVGNLGKFGLKIKACDARVEGQEAVPELLSALRRMRKEDIDVLVIIRGGGSIQSLIAFDNEMLVREIHGFPVPVVAGVGHHEDVTLAALASDASQSTPTAAANIIGRGYEKAREKVFKSEERVVNVFNGSLNRKKGELERFTYGISSFFYAILEEWKKKERKVLQSISFMENSLYRKREEVSTLQKRSLNNFSLLLRKRKEDVESMSRVIFSHDPQRQLRMGYSIVRKQGKVQKSVVPLKKGEDMEVFFSDGSTDVKIMKKHVKKNRSS